jgi:DNA-binding transcriptional LysR family regulator
MRNLDLDQLRAFLAVADLKGFTAAGEALGATQSAISLRVAKLEQQIGKRLLARTPRSVALTPEGARFLSHAEGIMAAHDTALAQMDGVQAERVTLRLAVSDHAAGAHLLAALSSLRSSLPHHVLDVTVGLSAEMRAIYDAGEVDAAIVRQDSDRREGTPLFGDPLVWVAAEAAEASANQPIDLVVLRGPCGVKAAMTRALDEAGLPWRIAFQGGSVMALQAAVVAGLGISVFGRAHVPTGSAVITRRLPKLPQGRVVLHARLATPQRTALAAAFKGAVRDGRD